MEQEELTHNYSISLYRELEKMGMGIKQIKLLLHTVTEIASANNISEDKATEKFFSDVQKQYDDKLGFELELQNLKSEVQKSENMQLELTNKTAALNSSILKQIDEIHQVSGIVEFLPLVKATCGLKVPKNDLKAAVIKAIDILKSTGSTGPSTRHLINSKLSLTNEIEQNPSNNFEWFNTDFLIADIGLYLKTSSQDQLEENFKVQGISKDQEVICYCHLGTGYDKVRLYDGSIIYWAQRRNPIR